MAKPAVKPLPMGKIINPPYPVFYVKAIKARAIASDSTGALFVYDKVGFNRYNENYVPYMYSTIPAASVTNVENKVKADGLVFEGWRLKVQVEVYTRYNFPQVIKYQLNESGQFTTIPLNSNDSISTHYLTYLCGAPTLTLFMQL